MAREQRLANGTATWWPDLTKPPEGGWKIRTDIPLMDNLYDLIHLQCSIWLNKYRVHAETREDMEDLEWQYYYATYYELVRRVRTGTYRRDLSLYLNVRSCAWSLFTRTFEPWQRHILERSKFIELSAGAIDNTHMGGIQEVIAADSVPKLMTDYDVYVTKLSKNNKRRREKKPNSRKAYSKGRVAQYMDDAWQSYQEELYEMGLPLRMTEEEFYTKNFPDDYRPAKEKLKVDIKAEERKAADLIKARYQRSSSSASNISGSTSTPSIE